MTETLSLIKLQWGFSEPSSLLGIVFGLPSLGLLSPVHQESYQESLARITYLDILQVPLSDFPSTDSLTMPAGYESSASLVVFGIEFNLSPMAIILKKKFLVCLTLYSAFLNDTGENVKWYSCFENSLAVSQKVKQRLTHQSLSHVYTQKN